jgi:hypothetical protein
MAIESIKQAVGVAIERASQATGVDFGFLMSTAKRESGFNPAAKAQTSSAGGLFQFVEQTWLGALKRHGAKHGYSTFADLIKTGADGRFSVAGGDAHKAVMALRMDPKAASLMAGELASDNAAYLRGRVGRAPTSGELYAAHFLGPKASADLIDARVTRPGASAAALFPEAASANPSIFYRDGRPASVAEVYGNLTAGQNTALTTAQSPTPVSYVHYDTGARLARLEQEHQLTAMLLGMGDTAAGKSSGGAQGLAGSMFSTEMLSLLSKARDADRKS